MRPIASIIFVSSWPARPTNGTPCSSSSAPGASPTNISSAVGSADAEHDLPAAERVQLAAGAVADVRADGGQRFGRGARQRRPEPERWPGSWPVRGCRGVRGWRRHGGRCRRRRAAAPPCVAAHAGDAELLVEAKMFCELGHGPDCQIGYSSAVS